MKILKYLILIIVIAIISLFIYIFIQKNIALQNLNKAIKDINIQSTKVSVKDNGCYPQRGGIAVRYVCTAQGIVVGKGTGDINADSLYLREHFRAAGFSVDQYNYNLFYRSSHQLYPIESTTSFYPDDVYQQVADIKPSPRGYVISVFYFSTPYFFSL